MRNDVQISRLQRRFVPGTGEEIIGRNGLGSLTPCYRAMMPVQTKMSSPECLVWPYYVGSWFSYGVLVIWVTVLLYGVPEPTAGMELLITLLDVRPEKRTLVMTISSIAMPQNHAI